MVKINLHKDGAIMHSIIKNISKVLALTVLSTSFSTTLVSSMDKKSKLGFSQNLSGSSTNSQVHLLSESLNGFISSSSKFLDGFMSLSLKNLKYNLSDNLSRSLDFYRFLLSGLLAFVDSSSEDLATTYRASLADSQATSADAFTRRRSTLSKCLNCFGSAGLSKELNAIKGLLSKHLNFYRDLLFTLPQDGDLAPLYRDTLSRHISSYNSLSQHFDPTRTKLTLRPVEAPMPDLIPNTAPDQGDRTIVAESPSCGSLPPSFDSSFARFVQLQKEHPVLLTPAAASGTTLGTPSKAPSTGASSKSATKGGARKSLADPERKKRKK